MNEPQFKIHGTERRELKSELSSLKRFVKYFWYDHLLDKEMSDIYGKTETYPMSDKNAKNLYDLKKNEIAEIENKLKLLYISHND